MFSLIYLFCVGLFFGGIARWLMPGDQQMGLLATAALGIAGSALGNKVDSWLEFGHPFILSVVGALGILAASVWVYENYIKVK